MRLFFGLLAGFLLFANCKNAAQAGFSAEVIGIKDGDTIEVLRGDKTTARIRLSDIDCPEMSQPFGRRAKVFASDFCYRKTVQIVEKGRPDRNGRLIAEVVLGDKILNQELVKAGLAWHFKKYSKDDAYDALETEARAQKKGLWADEEPIAPWEWRRK